MDLEAVHQGLADAASTVAGPPKLRAFASLPGAISPPVFAPTELEVAYDQAFGGGLVTVMFTCGLFTSVGDTPAGRAALMAYLDRDGTSSVKAALESDKTLGGVCKTLTTRRARGAYRLYEIGGVDYLGALLDVEVWV